MESSFYRGDQVEKPNLPKPFYTGMKIRIRPQRRDFEKPLYLLQKLKEENSTIDPSTLEERFKEIKGAIEELENNYYYFLSECNKKT